MKQITMKSIKHDQDEIERLRCGFRVNTLLKSIEVECLWEESVYNLYDYSWL